MRIAVYCGSSRRAPPRHLAAARAVGEAIARRGHTLVYGGNRTGSMGALADAALAAGGAVVGVILARFVEEGSHHSGLRELHCVDDLRQRKAGLEARADVFAALPGGLGTLEEVAEILARRKLGLLQRPLVLLNQGGFFEGLLAQLARARDEGFDRRDALAAPLVTADPDAVVPLCERSARRPAA